MKNRKPFDFLMYQHSQNSEITFLTEDQIVRARPYLRFFRESFVLFCILLAIAFVIAAVHLFIPPNLILDIAFLVLLGIEFILIGVIIYKHIHLVRIYSGTNQRKKEKKQ